MKDDDDRRDEALRGRAERQIGQGRSEKSERDLSAEEARALVRELRVHEVELRLQNEELVQAQQALAETSDRFIDLYDFAPVGYVTLSTDGEILDANLTCAAMLGLPRSAVTGGRLFRWVVEPDRAAWFDHLRTTADSGREGDCELRLVRADGTELDVLVQSMPVTDADATRLRSVVIDISARRAAERRWREADAIIEAAAEGVLVLDPDGRVSRVNPALLELTRFAASDFVGSDPGDWFSAGAPDDRFGVPWRVLHRTGRWVGEVECRRRDAQPFPARLSMVALEDERGRLTGYAGLLDDLTDRKALESQLRHRAYHDTLTALPNRLLLTERLDAAIREAQRHGQFAALMFLDVDRLKEINDRFGHEGGDALLCGVAERLVGCVREHDTVARLSGDEFAVVLTDVGEIDDVATVADKIMAAIAEPLRFGDDEMACSVSIGIAVYPTDARECDRLRRYADLAMYRAKSDSRNTYRFFNNAMMRKAWAHAKTKAELRHAVEAGEFRLVYQPIVCGRSGDLIGAEALLRWAHPTRGLLLPEPFLPLAEDSGQIVPIGMWVIDTVSRDWSSWFGDRGDRSLRDFTCCINVSAGQLRHPEAISGIIERLRGCGLPLARVMLEITESIAMSGIDAAREVLGRLKALGLRLAIDDFGTGYSSLGYLKRLPFDLVKIDRSFMHDVETSADAARLVEAIVQMAHGLRLRVVAEGVETAGELAFARECGCDGMQGNLICEPVTAEVMHGFLRDGLSPGESAHG